MMDRNQIAYQFFLDQGYTPVQAAGIVGGLRGETADLNTRQVHDGGIGLGIAGWNGPRLNGPNGLNAFAAQRGADPHDLNTQLAFVDHELRTSEGAAYNLLRGATTPEAAGDAMLRYFRPKDWNVPGAHPERANYAAQMFRSFGGQPQAPAPQAQVAFALPAPRQEAQPGIASAFDNPAPVFLPAKRRPAPPPETTAQAMDPTFLPRGAFRNRRRQIT